MSIIDDNLNFTEFVSIPLDIINNLRTMTTAKMVVEEQAWDGPLSRAGFHANRASGILRQALAELNHVNANTQPIVTRHPILLLHPVPDYDDNDSGYMSNNDNNDTNLPEPSSTPTPEINSNDSTAVVDGEQSRNDTPPDPEPSAGTLSRRTSTADAQAQVIASLREQVQDLFSQVTQLNNKLVKSYDRVSDLEDELHVTSSNLRSSSIKISNLELERAQHLSALNTGASNHRIISVRFVF